MRSAARKLYGTRLRRFTDHKPAGAPLILHDRHPAAVKGQSLFQARVAWPGFEDRLFKSGAHNRKIGARVVKGKWAGMPIYTLTLEERATCWSGCRHWLDCYGNKMNWSVRLLEGKALEWRLGKELRTLQQKHPDGFVVRLHVLGDFYSVGYVKRWLSWLRRFPALHLFGYSSWPPSTPVGAIIEAARDRLWDRFAVRMSNGGRHEKGAISVTDPINAPLAVVCPAQTDRTECCGTCALCWQTTRNIAFLIH
jgi:hypothetical protein